MFLFVVCIRCFVLGYFGCKLVNKLFKFGEKSFVFVIVVWFENGL